MLEQRWIWQSLNYPHFSYDEKACQSLINELVAYEKELRKLNENQWQTSFLQIQALGDEIIHSASIEGEFLRRESVRASLRKKLDEHFDALKDTLSTKQSDNYTNILLDTNLNKIPLSLERLHGWHNALFESGYSGLYKIKIACFREDTMQVVSGKIGKEKIHYKAPLAKDIEKHMQDFLNFCNHSSLNPYIKSAIAHLYFVIIHPYDDGNGRIARAIANFLLPCENIKFYSLSLQINIHKKEYYELLEKTNRNNEQCDITEWVKWHLKMTALAMKNTLKIVDRLIFKTQFWDKFKSFHLNCNQQKVLNKILDIGLDAFKGYLNVKKYASIAKINKNTAIEELEELCQIGCLLKDKEHFMLQTNLKQDKSYFSNLQDLIEKTKQAQNEVDKRTKERQNSNSNDEILQTESNTQKNRLRRR